MLRLSILKNTMVIYLIMVLLGVLVGFSDNQFLHSIGLTLADIFIKIFRCISTPIIALSIIVTLASFGGEGAFSRLWKKTLLYTLGTTLIAASVSCVLYILLAPQNVNTELPVNAVAATQGSYLTHLSALIPSNILTPFLEQQVLSVLLIGILVGIAIQVIPDKAAKQSITHFFQGLYSIFLIITKWVIAILPLGLFGFITSTVIQLKSGVNLSGIGTYLVIIVLANLIQGFLILPLWLKTKGLNPVATMQKMLPALSLAFFSKSSSGTLPVTIDTAEKNLALNPKISRFVLPLCTSINMNGCAAFIFTTVIYLMQNHGVDITYLTMLTWIVVATIAAIGNAGVPMGCFFLSASLLSSMHVPITLLGLILPFYSVIDMIETALNVWSDSCVATVVNKEHAYETDLVLET